MIPIDSLHHDLLQSTAAGSTACFFLFEQLGCYCIYLTEVDFNYYINN